ncbi:hypothetical protein HBH98_077500 [Parastagonospora nodorum]|nr:hypothetical protein HBH50_119530 [Parastagonospora nodorum]KAH4100432.1 hypothetical protein HBH48_021070 [Parastagonospora nodorum]KAH4105456.1 hypothetical protein HBH46_084220 [Parastagonospora nodorum]KAH4122094.1 hypothetical protein HBH47_086750 [Parastagonospora nodorum]KAH4179140.1 hypothetical protein HBH43_013340 [Parastagonospora nodorum]
MAGCILNGFCHVCELSVVLPSSSTSARLQHPVIFLLPSLEDVEHARQCGSRLSNRQRGPILDLAWALAFQL